MMDFQKFIEWSFLAIIGGGVAWSASFLQRIAKSIVELNVKLAALCERTSWHSRELDDHNHRIGKLETRKK